MIKLIFSETNTCGGMAALGGSPKAGSLWALDPENGLYCILPVVRDAIDPNIKKEVH